MALPKTLLCFLLILLGFSCIIGSNAIPITRTRSLMNENIARFQAYSMNSHLDVVKPMKEGTLIERKMAEVELQDYPGSGANNRHTPRP